MSDSRSFKLLELLDANEWRTSADIAQRIGRSERTVRASLGELDDLLREHGAAVESKRRYGYRLRIDDRTAFEDFVASFDRGSLVPDGGEERVDYLVMGLLYLMGYVKSQDLCDVFFISPTTLSATIRAAEVILMAYDISIERRPNYGIRAVGSEANKRRLIAERFVRNEVYPAELGNDAAGRLDELAREAKGVLAKHDLSLTEFAFESLVSYCLVARSRMFAGFSLSFDDESLPEVSETVRQAACDLERAMQVADCPSHTPDETRYLELYLAGSRRAGDKDVVSNFVINERTDRVTVEILSLLSNDYGINFLRNFDLRLQLNQHLAPMDIRMRFGIRSHNPLLDEIRQHYPLSYQMAQLAGEVLRNHYGRPVPEDELGYIALILQVAVEFNREDRKHDILIVSGIGRSSSHLLKHRFEELFGDYLGNIYLCDPFGLDSFDFSKVKYIFTTVPIKQAVPLPVLEVDPFLAGADALRVKNALQADETLTVADRFIGPGRLIDDLTSTTREELLYELCERIADVEDVSGRFFDLVMEREDLAQMRLGTGVALPHPNGIASKRTFAYVAVLPKPVLWREEPVRVIILVSMGSSDEGEEDRRILNEMLARLALSADAIASLAAEPTYERLLELLESSGAKSS